jgi:hypothetical protein
MNRHSGVNTKAGCLVEQKQDATQKGHDEWYNDMERGPRISASRPGQSCENGDHRENKYQVSKPVDEFQSRRKIRRVI